MAQDTSLNGLRSKILTSLFGRRAGLAWGNSSDNNSEYLVGIRAVAEQVEGVSSAGSTIVSTAVTNNLSPFGISLVGATAASATTAYQLAAPVPGVRKVLFNPTTGSVTFLTTAAGGFICSTASVTSTHGSVTLTGKGVAAELIGITTALWGVLSPQGVTTVTTNYTFV